MNKHVCLILFFPVFSCLCRYMVTYEDQLYGGKESNLMAVSNLMVHMVYGFLNWRNKGRLHLSRKPFQQNNAESLPSMCRPYQFSQSRFTWLYRILIRWATVMIPTFKPQSHRNQWSQWYQRSRRNQIYKLFSPYTYITCILYHV